MKCDIVQDPNSQGDKRIRFQIKDYGTGIAPENYERIFEPFSQENQDTGTIYGGTGLGLPITKKLTEKLGGTISVSSKVGEWTEFTVEFPFQGQEVTQFDDQVTRLANTAILVVVARPTTDCPVIKWLRDQNITVKLIAQCDALETTARQIEANLAPGQKQYYISLIHDEGFNEVLYRRFAAAHASQLMTFGYKNLPLAAAHVHSPCRVFPSLFLPILGDLVARLKSSRMERIDTTLDSSILVINNQAPVTVPKKTTAQNCSNIYGNLRILIAEDNRINQRVLNKTLTRLGLSEDKIDIVENGLEAVKAANEKAYDVIFMDMEMPVMNGLEACRQITKGKARLLPVVVFCTAHAMETFRTEARQAGGYGFISKPFNLERIDAVLKSVPWDTLTEAELRARAVLSTRTPVLQ